MVRLFLPSASPSDKELSITDEKARYLMSVLRCRKGDELIGFDGKGACFSALITETRRREVVAKVLETFSCNLESPLDGILVQGILRGEKMDMVVQKSTELGISGIVPVITERSQLRDSRRVKRWAKIAEEAARQSGRSVVPVVHKPVELEKFLTSPVAGPKFEGFIFYEEDGISLRQAYDIMQGERFRGQDDAPRGLPGQQSASHPLHILIGPEGGFTKDEVGLAEKQGLVIASLGKRVLRAETAAISAITLIQYLFGDMG